MNEHPTEPPVASDFAYIADDRCRHRGDPIGDVSELELVFGPDTLKLVWLRSGTGMTVQSIGALEGKRLRIAFFRDGITVQMRKNLESE